MRIKKGTGYNALPLPVASRLVLVAPPIEANFYSLACGGGGVCPCSTPILCSCSTTSSLTCNRPTSSSSMSRRPILPRFTASARMAKAPIATAPAALAPTAKAPRAVHASPVTTRANATCAPNGGCSFRLALCILFTVLSFPTRLEKTLGANPFHHKHDATSRSLASNFLELRHGEARLVPGPMGQDFSGSCTVTRRNPLIHNGATTATKSGRFDPQGPRTPRSVRSGPPSRISCSPRLLALLPVVS